MKRLCWILIGVVLTGCSAAYQRRSADAEINRLLDDRQKQTVAYTPSVKASATEAPPISRAAYNKLPVSPLPPMVVAATRPEPSILSSTPLGPEFSRQITPTIVDTWLMQISPDVVAERAANRFKLGPRSPFAVSIRMDLFTAIEYAAQHARDYQSQNEELYLSALDVSLQRHLLSPRPFVSTSVDYTGGQKDINYRSALSVTSSAGVKQRLPYGGEIVAQGLVGFVNTLSGPVSDGESARLSLSGSIPLLRGAGMVNLEDLIDSERRMVYAIRTFEDFRRQFAVNIAAAYFRLITSQQSVNNRRLNLGNLALLTDRTQNLYAAGRINFLEVQRSLQAQLVAQTQLVDAQDNYQSAIDDFKVLIGMNVQDELEISPVEIRLSVPDIETTDTVALAMKYRLDLQTARDQMDDSRRAVSNARNGLLPDLSLHADASSGNRAGTAAARLDGRSTEYAAGVTLDLPVDRLAERNAYRASLINLDRSRRDYEDLTQRIISDVRESARGIRSAQISLRLQQNGIDLALRRLDFANELLRRGRAGITARDVVEAQSSLLSAQDAYDRARADLQIRILQFLRNTGTLRVDPSAGALGEAMTRNDGNPTPTAESFRRRGQ